MSRKYSVVLAGVLLGILVVAGCAYSVLRHEPEFYRAALHDGLSAEERREYARKFEQTTGRLIGEAGNDERWSQEFSEVAVNSWLADELPGKYAELLPENVSAPRIKFEKDGLRIAFRTSRGPWSGIVSGRLNVWVPSPNELAVQVQSLSAGLVPIPVDEFSGKLVEALGISGWRTEWKQSTGGDVLVVALDEAESARAQPRLEAVELQSGRLRISGSRTTGEKSRTARRPAANRQEGSGGDAVK
jgi:hypothetical protein